MAEAPPNQRPMQEDSPTMLSWISKASKSIQGALARHFPGQSAAGPVLFACLCLAIALKNWKQQRGRRPHRAVLHRSLSMAALHGGKVALQRILDSAETRVDDSTLRAAARNFSDLLAVEPLKFNELQREAARLEMSGREDEAVEMLREAWRKVEKDGKPHEAHELQMLFVEMLIYKGDYLEALDCKCLQDEEISDARGPLYKAIVCTIVGEKNSAKEHYKEFQKIRSMFHSEDSFPEGSLLHGVVHNFETFEMIVNNLKKEIEHSQKIKAV